MSIRLDRTCCTIQSGSISVGRAVQTYILPQTEDKYGGFTCVRAVSDHPSRPKPPPSPACASRQKQSTPLKSISVAFMFGQSGRDLSLVLAERAPSPPLRRASSCSAFKRHKKAPARPYAAHINDTQLLRRLFWPTRPSLCHPPLLYKLIP